MITINQICAYMVPHRGNIVVAEGELLRTTASMFFTQLKLIDPEDDLLCSTATATYKPKPKEPQH